MLAADLGGTFGWTADPVFTALLGTAGDARLRGAGDRRHPCLGQDHPYSRPGRPVRERGIHVATVEVPARRSPFIEEIVVHGRGRFDLETEADLFGARSRAPVRWAIRSAEA
jgi:hypothetical protein